MAHLPLSNLIASGIDDTDLMPGQGRPQDTNRRAVESSSSAGTACPERVGIAPMIDPDTTAGRWKGHQRGFGQAVHRRHGLGSKPYLAKRSQRVTVSGLMGSAPFSAICHELRSRPSMSRSSMRRRQSS